MTHRRSETTWVPATVSRRWLTVDDITAALMGVVATLGAMAVMMALLASGVTGIDILETGTLEPLATSTVATTILVVFAASFCGGWVYSALRRRDEHGRLGDARDLRARRSGSGDWLGAVGRPAALGRHRRGQMAQDCRPSLVRSKRRRLVADQRVAVVSGPVKPALVPRVDASTAFARLCPGV